VYFYLETPATRKAAPDKHAVMDGDRAPVAMVQGIGDNLSMVSDTQQRAWMAQWHAARAALGAQRAAELRALSNDQALAAADGLLSLACVPAVSATRRSSSGLVQQQAILHRRPVP